MEREEVSYEELEKAYLDQVEHTNLVRESYVEMLKKLDVTHESLKTRLAALEAALSLSTENVKQYYKELEISDIDIRHVISGIRRRIGLEVKDGE